MVYLDIIVQGACDLEDITQTMGQLPVLKVNHAWLDYADGLLLYRVRLFESEPAFRAENSPPMWEISFSRNFYPDAGAQLSFYPEAGQAW